MPKINIKLRHFPGDLSRRIQIELVSKLWFNKPNSRLEESNRRRAKVYKNIRRMNEKARIKENTQKEIDNELKLWDGTLLDGLEDEPLYDHP